MSITVTTRADVYTFNNWISVTNKVPENVAIGLSQLSIEVSDYWENGYEQVLFTFYNTGTEASSIGAIYFDDGHLLGTPSILDFDYDPLLYPLVDFEVGGKNKPPGASAIVPEWTTSQDFTTSADNPIPTWGVNPGESLGLVFDIEDDFHFDDIISAIYLGFTDPEEYSGDWYSDSLRIALHVQAFELGGDNASETFLLVPIPGAVLLAIFGLGAVGVKLRKFA